LRILKQSNGVPWNIPNPSESMYFAVARPITRPVLSKTGPPEFPWFIGAVVVPVNLALLTLETIPVVSTPGNPSGLPIIPDHHPCSGVAPLQFNGWMKVDVRMPATSFASSHA